MIIEKCLTLDNYYQGRLSNQQSCIIYTSRIDLINQLLKLVKI